MNKFHIGHTPTIEGAIERLCDSRVIEVIFIEFLKQPDPNMRQPDI